ncbi:MAG TPA: histidine kinase dimerization/phosphoacceptor domain -containing protein [Rectinemataceae bacterium]|nr:histidine kinase dimerization/phosphoacceptor domain -containing protein [Rectinemataceae bacterium]
MNIQLLVALGSQGLSLLLLLGVFVIARKGGTRRFSRYWIAGWSLYSLRFSFEFLAALFPSTDILPSIMLALAGASSAYLFAAALTLVSDRILGWWTAAVSAAIALAILGALLGGATKYEVTLVVFLLLGIVQGYTGILFIGAFRKSRSIGTLVAGIAMILWGLHKWDYPFLRPLAWFAPLGYQISVFFQTATGIAVAMMLYEGMRAAAEREAARYRGLFESLNDCVYVTDFEGGSPGRFLEVNDVAVATLGYDREDFARMKVAELDALISPPEREADMEILRRGGRAVFRRVHVTKDGRRIPFEVSTRRIDYDGRPALIGIARNMALREAGESQLREALAQKELLLREIHHRVKNNLQIVSSLLTLQERTMRDPSDAESIAGIQARISSMALVHEMLYRDPSISAVAMGVYLRELADSIVSSWAATRVGIELEVGDIAYPIDRAIPVGLIVSELAMNACKHAFRGREEGRLRLSLSRGEGIDRLVVGDDGVGMPEGRGTDSLGLEIVRVLVRQLRGTMNRIEGPGTVWSIELPAETED